MKPKYDRFWHQPAFRLVKRGGNLVKGFPPLFLNVSEYRSLLRTFLTLGKVSKLPALAQPKGPLFIQLARMDIINQI